MKASNLRIIKKSIIAAVAFAGLTAAPTVHAGVEVFLVGGSASQSVLYDRATNLFSGGTGFTVKGGGSSAIAQFSGTSANPALSGFGTITLDININNGAVDGLQALVNQSANADDTNYSSPSIPQVPTFVDSATSPEAVGVSSVNLKALPTYVVPFVYIKNTNSTDTAAITNLTQRQAWSLENYTLQAAYFGSAGDTNNIYFVGRNLEAAVRTEIDANIYNTLTINSYVTNSLGQPVLDPNVGDPGLTAGGAVASTVLVLTNAIGTVAVQNLKKGLGALSYEGVAYSVTNVINGSYPLWGYENYYYISPTAQNNTGTPSAPQLAVINAFYQSVTNATFETTAPSFVGNFIPNSALQVQRASDGGQIQPIGNNFQN
jgi:hypothetical protein